MNGSVIAFDPGSNTGAISGYDGGRYDFAIGDWHGGRRPQRGDTVDFTPNGQRAAQVSLAQSPYTRPDFAQFFFSPYGRVSRSEYWLRYFLPVFGISIVLNVLVLIGSVSHITPLSATAGSVDSLFQLAAFWPGLAVLIKRIHDRNKSGLLVLVPVGMFLFLATGLIICAIFGGDTAMGVFAAIWGLGMVGISIWFLVEFGCLRGTIGPNRFGPDPVREG